LAATNGFPELMQRVRSGDQEAATELVRGYERTIRRAVRIWLMDARLRRTFDSMDVCQSVLGSFFVRAALGQFQLEHPEQLVRLLVQMARNKLTDEVRRQRAGRRDNRRLEGGDVHEREVIAVEAGPSRQVAGRDLLQEVRKRLSPEERTLADRRAVGRDWPDIAAELGGDPCALRKKLTRAINRITRELGLDDD
jgi:RNA polymerase sigma factor (sigma-70 family)